MLEDAHPRRDCGLRITHAEEAASLKGLWLVDNPCQSKGNHLEGAMEEKSEKHREAEGKPYTLIPPS